MRLSTLNMHMMAMNNMLLVQSRVGKLVEQISTGKRILSPSDDVVGSSKANLLNMNNKALAMYQRNNTIAENKLSLTEDVLTQINDTLLRVDELQKQAMNGALKQEDKLIIAGELETRLQDLIGLANSKDSEGKYLFSGFKNDTQAYVKNGDAVSFQGDQGQRLSQIGSSLYVPINFSGFEVFEDVFNGNGTFVTSDGVVNNTGSGVISTGNIFDKNAYVPENYTINFVTNGSSELAYEVVGSMSGQLIPPLPAASPTDAPAFKAGDSIKFNGIEISITGEPDVGDDFSIEPSTRQNIFTSLQQMIDALKSPDSNSNQHANYINQMDRAAVALNQGSEQVLLMITKVGTHSETLDRQKLVNEDLKIHNDKTLGMIQDIDPAEAISKMTMEMTSLQTAQASFAKVMQLSLFNYI